MYDVFISYRREGGEFLAMHICSLLKERGYHPFYDIESMRNGRFNEQIYSVIAKCSDMILILPPHALDRCRNDGDWVREEIAHALRCGLNIVPVMMNGFDGFPEDLPDDIADVKYCQGVSASTEFFDAAMNRICGYLKAMGAMSVCPHCGMPTSADRSQKTDCCAHCGKAFLIAEAQLADSAQTPVQPAPAAQPVQAAACQPADRSPEFHIKDGELIRYTGRGGTVWIPAGVTAIGQNAFLGRSDITAIQLPFTLTKIGQSAFQGCTGLTEIQLPRSLVVLSAYAFRQCTALRRVQFVRTPAAIGGGAFADCTQLTDVAFPMAFIITCDTGGIEIGKGVFLHTPLENRNDDCFRYFK